MTDTVRGELHLHTKTIPRTAWPQRWVQSEIAQAFRFAKSMIEKDTKQDRPFLLRPVWIQIRARRTTNKLGMSTISPTDDSILYQEAALYQREHFNQ